MALAKYNDQADDVPELFVHKRDVRKVELPSGWRIKVQVFAVHADTSAGGFSFA